MIYFDNAATTLQKPPQVEEAVLRAMRTLGNAGRGAHEPTLQAAREIYETRVALAELFHISDPMRIAFTSNATEAMNTAISGLFCPGDHVVTTVCEHNSVLRPLYRMEQYGVELSFLQADRNGLPDYSQLETLCRRNTKAIVMTHASNLTGNVNDLKRVSAFAKEKGLLLVTDAAQTAGIIPIDVQELGIDVLCFTGHKGLLGPQGTGGLYVRSGIVIPSFKVGGSGVHSYDRVHPDEMPTALEAGTLNGHGIAGLRAALGYLKQTGIEQIYEKERKLADRFVNGIRDIPGVTLYGDFSRDDAAGSRNRVAIVSLNIRDEDSAAVADWLWEDYGICVRAGAHCAPLMHRTFGTVNQGAVRFSFSHYNTEEEIDLAIRAVRELAQ